MCAVLLAALLALQSTPASPAIAPVGAPPTVVDPKPSPAQPTAQPTTPPATEPTAAPSAPPSVAPTVAPTVAPAVAPTVAPAVAPAVAPPQNPSDLAPAKELHKRAFIVVDRVTTAAGAIETDDADVIVLRDEKGRIRSFSKNRIVSLTYLLEGPVGRRVRVVFNDRRTLVGKLIDDGYSEATIEIEGIQTKYSRDAVSEVIPYPTDMELYERFRTTLEPDQFSTRYTLAMWLYNKKMYSESKKELESLLESTNHYEAKQLLNEVTAQLVLMTPIDDEPARVKPSVDAGDSETPSNLVSDSDVNLMRVYELDLADPPRMQVSEELIAAMLEKYADSALIPATAAEKTSFYSKDPVDIVKILFALKARELYPQINVRGEPEALNTFRQRVHNAWLINNCATSRCHGGTDAGRLFLHNRNHKDDNVRSTNLLILTRTTLDGLPLIDFEKPTDSLIYQYALPTTEARRPHPDVRGWEPVFMPLRRGLQEDFVKWVRGMRVRAGEYPIEYTPPAMKSPDAVDHSGPDR